MTSLPDFCRQSKPTALRSTMRAVVIASIIRATFVHIQREGFEFGTSFFSVLFASVFDSPGLWLVMVVACTARTGYGRGIIPKGVVSATSLWWVNTGGRTWQKTGNCNEPFAAQRGVGDDHSIGSVVCLFCLCFFLVSITECEWE